MSKDELSLEDFKEWWKDPRGEWFWDGVRDVRKAHQLDLAHMVRSGKYDQASGSQGGIDALDHVLAIPREIIDEKGEASTIGGKE